MKKALWTTLKGGLKPRQRKAAKKAEPKPRKRIKPRSHSMATKMAAYRLLKAVLLRRHPNCMACSKPWGRLKLKWGIHPATELHHIRGRYGSLLVDVRYLLPVCSAGHRAIHEHPEEARKAGLLCDKGEWGKKEQP